MIILFRDKVTHALNGVQLADLCSTEDLLDYLAHQIILSLITNAHRITNTVKLIFNFYCLTRRVVFHILISY